MLKLIRSEMVSSTVTKWNYFIAVFECRECGKNFYLTTRSLLRDHDSIVERFKIVKCPKCLTNKKPSLEDIIPFPIDHLEEFIAWTD